MGVGGRTSLTHLLPILLPIGQFTLCPFRSAWAKSRVKSSSRGEGTIFGVCGAMRGLLCSLPRTDRNIMLGFGAPLHLFKNFIMKKFTHT